MTLHIILSGIPGSGKSTKAKELKEHFEKKGKKVAIYSRDAFRKAWLHEFEGEPFDSESAYQNSFMDANQNMWVKEDFYSKIIDGLDLDDDVHIYDMTNTSKEDLYFWFEFATYAKPKGDRFKFYFCHGEYGSTHNVPEKVMEKYRKDLKDNENLWYTLHEYIEFY